MDQRKLPTKVGRSFDLGPAHGGAASPDVRVRTWRPGLASARGGRPSTTPSAAVFYFIFGLACQGARPPRTRTLPPRFPARAHPARHDTHAPHAVASWATCPSHQRVGRHGSVVPAPWHRHAPATKKKTAGAWAQQQRGGRRPPHPRPTPVRAHPLPEQGASEDGTPSPCPRPSSSVFFTWPPMTTMEGSIDQSEGRLESAVPALSPSRVAAPCRRLTSWTTDCMPSAMVGRGGAERGVCVRKKWEGARGRGQDPGARKKKG